MKDPAGLGRVMHEAIQMKEPGIAKLMQTILERRWNEVQRCIATKANLAATVMMSWLFKKLATRRTDAPLFKKVETLRWRGATPAFAKWAKRMEAPAARALRKGCVDDDALMALGEELRVSRLHQDYGEPRRSES